MAGLRYHMLFLSRKGKVYGTGRNDYSQLGTKTLNANSKVYELEINNVKQVATGLWHSVMLKNDGTVWTLGNNNRGQLGLGHNGPISVPTKIPGIENVKQVACGEDSTFLLFNDGTVKSCGNNQFGRIGFDKDEVTEINILQDIDIFDVNYISCGTNHTIFLTNNGDVYGAGHSVYGQIEGINTNKYQNGLKKIIGIENVKQISCGTEHTMYLLNDNGIKIYGRNSRGQLGNGSSGSYSYGISALNIDNICEVIASEESSFFVLNDGTYKACGYNYRSALYVDSTNDNIVSPQQGSINNVQCTQIVNNNTFFIKRNGDLLIGGSSSDITAGRYDLGPIPFLPKIVQIAEKPHYQYKTYPDIFLVQKDNTRYTVKNNELEEIIYDELTKEYFNENGFYKLKTLTKELQDKLDNNFEILLYNEEDVEDYKPEIKIKVPEFTPCDKFDNPELITYSIDGKEPIIKYDEEYVTKTRYLISKDGKNFQTFKNNEWQYASKKDIILKGMTSNEIQNLSPEKWRDWEDAIYGSKFEILIGIDGEMSNIPTVSSIQVNMAENQAPIVISAQITPDNIHNEYAMLNARVKDFEGENVKFKILTKVAGSDNFVQTSPISGWYEPKSSQVDITQAFNYTNFNPGENIIRMVVSDETGLETVWERSIVLENSNPKIVMTNDDLHFMAAIGDNDNDEIIYRISINEKVIVDYDLFYKSPLTIKHIFEEKNINLEEQNLITIEAKDTHGGYVTKSFFITGTRRGILLKNDLGQTINNHNGEISMDKLFKKTMIGGQISETKTLVVENSNEHSVSNLQIQPQKLKGEYINTGEFAPHASLEISKEKIPFTPVDVIKYTEEIASQGHKEFYIRINTTTKAYEGGDFYINVTANLVED